MTQIEFENELRELRCQKGAAISAIAMMQGEVKEEISVEAKEYETVRKLHAKAKQLEKERDEFGDQVYDALVALRTEKAVEKELPEAMKYLVFPEVKAVPMPVFTGLRDIIGKIKED